MCHVASATFPALHRSPGHARRWTQRRLDAWGVDDAVFTLLVSELVTNSVRHARTPATLTLALSGGRLEVGVVDDDEESVHVVGLGGGTDAAEHGERLAESGHGLRLLDALADAWGVTRTPSGKRVWFHRLVRTDGLATTCRCEAQMAQTRDDRG